MSAREIHAKITGFVGGLDQSLCASVAMVFKEKLAQVNISSEA